MSTSINGAVEQTKILWQKKLFNRIGMAAVQKNEGESMIPKWKKSKLVGGRKIFLYFQKGIINKGGKKKQKFKSE